MNTDSEAVLITGASHRLGLAIALKSIELGFHAIVHYRTERDELKKLLENTPELRSQITTIHYDLTQTPETLVDKAISLPQRLIGLVNNASIFTPGNLTDYNHLEQILNINALIPSRLAAHFSKKCGNGWVINITDAICNKPNVHYQNYRISKVLLELLTQQQAMLFAPGIRVNAIAPGAMIPGGTEDAEYFKALESQVPMKKTGDIKSLLDTYAYLIGTPYINGQILRVDGGWSVSP
jgi:NAD(P)-dependent dehydrogenase (short-subunit alcohol dehydrogenase family)